MNKMELIKKLLLLVAITLVQYPRCATSANILVAHPATTIFLQSHIRFQSVLSHELLKRGHRVVILSSSILKDRGNSEENYSEMVTFKLPYDDDVYLQRHHTFFNLVTNPNATVSELFSFSETLHEDCNHLFNDAGALEKLKSEKFDLILLNPFGTCEYLLHCYLGVPYVVFTPAMRFPTFNEDIFRVPSPMSYVPGVMTGLSDDMSLFQRTVNVISKTIILPIFSYYMISSDHIEKIKEDKGLCPETPLFELIRKAELWLVNADVAGDFALPTTPNVISIGGLMNEPAKPLEPEFKMFVEDPEMNGVIIVSMGSSLTLGEKDASMYINALGGLPYGVIFRHTGKITQNVSDNIKIVQWMPQNDLLGHPRTKLFIGHAGLGGIYEALYNAVPMVLIPHGLDQMDNAVRMCKKGVALCLDRQNLDEKNLHDAAIEVLSQKRYKDAAEHWSNIHKDQPLTPRERAVFWIEHVLKYGGAHLRPRGADMNFIQYYMLDVAILIATFVTLFVVICTTCCVKGYKLICHRNNFKQKQS
ncbi:UDP-glucuronosyltransferase 2C1-like [Amphiura filiformis]|uniref:UDP-glucuronosyltransferase 2C1-like n=1 Tax=Amphiura filiformis TaxID=82378 RepID=UPI003B212F74